MKKLCLFFIICGCFLQLEVIRAGVTATNLDGMSIEGHGNGDCIHAETKEQKKVDWPKDATLLFYNGSLMLDCEAKIQDTKILLPIRSVMEELGSSVSWDQEKKAVFVDGENAVVYLDKEAAQICDAEYEMELPAQLIDGTTYVPADFFTQYTDLSVNYFDGKDETLPHILPLYPQVMISSYEEGEVPLSKKEATEIVRQQLIEAYELKFGEYIPWPEGKELITGVYDDSEFLRQRITELKVTNENDRFYVLPVVYDFWVDKYTGKVYTFYRGITFFIKTFDPEDKNALAFPG